jgi:hypothetical protein
MTKLKLAFLLLRAGSHSGQSFFTAVKWIQQCTEENSELTFTRILIHLRKSRNTKFCFQLLNVLLAMGPEQLEKSKILQLSFLDNELKALSVRDGIKKAIFVFLHYSRVHQ